jgi:type II secretory pathway pseudopilin PulG
VRPSASRPQKRTNGAFSLVELLLVAAIIAIMMSVLAYSLNQARGPAVQVAAGQVASGLQLARQIAIGKNTHARFIVSPNAKGNGLPETPFRYWAVISSNKNAANSWTLEKDWEPLPVGVIFLNIPDQSYSTINWDPIPPGMIGTPYKPTFGQAKAGEEYKTFASHTTSVLSVMSPFKKGEKVFDLPNQTPFIGFKPTGAAQSGGGIGQKRLLPIRLAEGAITPEGMVSVQNDRNATYIETDTGIGKVVVRPRESYRETTQ